MSEKSSKCCMGGCGNVNCEHCGASANSKEISSSLAANSPQSVKRECDPDCKDCYPPVQGEDECKHEHFSPFCNACQKDMVSSHTQRDKGEPSYMEIPLTKGKFSLIDKEDYPMVSRHKWHEHDGYATKCSTRDKKRFGIKLHRFIMRATDREFVDHINHNRLDNRKENLRICTIQQNSWNARKTDKKKSSIYKGVCFHKATKKWRARIKINRKDVELGLFLTEKEAALAYNEGAIIYHKEWAVLNKM